MEERIERAIEFANMHKNARLKAGKSQEFMALNLGVTKKTVSNWEKGLSSPSYFQSLEWFRCLNMNPFPEYLKYTFPKPDHITEMDMDLVLDKIINVLPASSKLALLYLFIGEHGASPSAIINMILAHLHCPVKVRLAQATLIAHDYEIEKGLDSLICKDDIMPDMDMLNLAISKAMNSTLNHEFGYTDLNEEK